MVSDSRRHQPNFWRNQFSCLLEVGEWGGCDWYFDPGLYNRGNLGNQDFNEIWNHGMAFRNQKNFLKAFYY